MSRYPTRPAALRPRPAPVWVTVLLPLVSLASLAHCAGETASPGWEYMPDMVHSVAYDTFAPNPLNPNRQTLRQPVPGTVPRGHRPFPYGPEPEEAARAARELRNPFLESPEVLARGQDLYRTFCQPCHGAGGAGDGPVTKKFPPPPAYTSTRVKDLPPGHLYHVISRGKGRMPPYASQISPDDRWRLVAWVQRLQQGPPGPQAPPQNEEPAS